MLFCPDSSLCLKKYPRNINHIPVVFFQACLDFDQNRYSRTSSQHCQSASGGICQTIKAIAGVQEKFKSNIPKKVESPCKIL